MLFPFTTNVITLPVTAPTFVHKVVFTVVGEELAVGKIKPDQAQATPIAVAQAPSLKKVYSPSKVKALAVVPAVTKA